jgi:hypothetical protein
MKKYMLIVAFFLLRLITSACPLCAKQQPKILRGVIHGTGPQDNWDYLILWSAVAVVIFTLFFSLKWLIYPGEKNSSHIKRLIFNQS